jgi:hypothetical protein
MARNSIEKEIRKQVEFAEILEIENT